MRHSRGVIGYIRVSTDEQVLGPEVQRAALKRWCGARGGRLLRVFIDQGASGGESPQERPGLLAALAAVRNLGAGVLLVAKRDRLARDTVLAATIERAVECDGAAVRSADGLGEGDAPEAVLMRRIADAFAEYERLVIRARTRAALADVGTRRRLRALSRSSGSGDSLPPIFHRAAGARKKRKSWAEVFRPARCLSKLNVARSFFRKTVQGLHHRAVLRAALNPLILPGRPARRRA
jgi:DNA invertase Pin-like site-specific DNA recombinase